MARHVVGSLVGVGEVGIVFRNEPAEIVLEIAPRGGIRVFHKDQAAARMLAKYGNLTLGETGLIEGVANVVGYVVGALPLRPQLRFGLCDFHSYRPVLRAPAPLDSGAWSS